MALNVSRSTLRTRVSRLLELPSSGGPFDSTALNDELEQSAAVYWSRLTEALPERYETTQSISANGAASYSLNSNYFRARSLHLQETSPTPNTLIPPLALTEREVYSKTGSEAAGWWIAGSSIYLRPAPASGTYIFTYVPAWGGFANDAATIDGYSGWEQWIVYDVAVRLGGAENPGEVGLWIQERARLQAEMEQAAQASIAALPRTIRNVRDLGFGRRLRESFWDRQ